MSHNYYVLNQDFCEQYKGHQVGASSFNYAITKNGLYVTSTNSANEFPDLFENLMPLGQLWLSPDEIEYYSDPDLSDTRKKVLLNQHIKNHPDQYNPPCNVDFITSTSVKLHRKSYITKGECYKEEFYLHYDGQAYSQLMVKEETSFTRDPLGFPIYKDVKISWATEDGDFHQTTKTWKKYYSSLEKISEGKFRRGNLIQNLQIPCIGFISLSRLGNFNATPEVILEGRRFLADYKNEFELFIQDSNKDIISCLNDVSHPKYISVADYDWIDSQTPYGVTVRQWLIGEMSI